MDSSWRRSTNNYMVEGEGDSGTSGILGSTSGVLLVLATIGQMVGTVFMHIVLSSV